MNILYLCHRFPFPPRRGGKIRPFNMIRHLSQSHRVSVCSLVRSPDEAREGAGLADHCHRYEMVPVSAPLQFARMLARLPSATPSSFGWFYARALDRRVRELAQRERFDLAFVHCSSVARYVEPLAGTTRILDFGDMDSCKWRDYAEHKPWPLSWGFALEAAKLAREEARLARHFDFCTATTRAEWETLEGYRTGTPSDWFPNGVDSEYFRPAEGPYRPEHLVFVGRMDYFPNQECMVAFCRDVMPRLRAERPGVTLSIVGADPPPSMRRLAREPGVVVTGSVPDVRPYLHEAALMVAPLNIARGTQNKILEGMAAGLPVVASRIAAAGVDAHATEHLLVASTPDEIAAAVLSILDDPALRARLVRAGRERILSNHAWPQSMRRLDGIIERALAASGRYGARPSATLGALHT